MGAVKEMHINRYPEQYDSETIGGGLGIRVEVTFHYQFKNTIKGTIIRADRTAPYEIIILLDDGRVVRGSECQYVPTNEVDKNVIKRFKFRSKERVKLRDPEKEGWVCLKAASGRWMKCEGNHRYWFFDNRNGSIDKPILIDLTQTSMSQVEEALNKVGFTLLPYPVKEHLRFFYGSSNLDLDHEEAIAECLFNLKIS